MPRAETYAICTYIQTSPVKRKWVVFIMWSILYICIYTYVHIYVYIHMYIQGVPGGKDLTPGGCSLGQTIPI
jgi:hypothetical protein